MKKSFLISEDEKKRIMSLHESAKLSHGTTVLEQAQESTQQGPLTIPLGGTFQSGKAEIANYESINNAKTQIMNYLKNFPKNQKIDLNVVAGESQVPNQPPYDKKQGSLAYARALALRDAIIKSMPEYKNILNFGEKPEIQIGKTPWDPAKGAKDPDYTKEQFVNVVIKPSGEKPIAPFCKGGKVFRQQRYYPGHSPMLGKNWKVDVEGHPNFGKQLPTLTYEVVMVCPNSERYYFPLESDFKQFANDPQNNFDNREYSYNEGSANFPDDDYLKTEKQAGYEGNNIKKFKDGDILKTWYHPSPVPLMGRAARRYLGVSSQEHLDSNDKS